MTDFLIHHFIKDYKNIKSFAVREGFGRLSGIVGIIVNILLFCAKITAGLLFHSISVIADAVNNLSDAGSSVITLVGFKISGKPADEQHPYGHARSEYVAGLITSFIIMLLGFELLTSSAQKILNPSSVNFSLITVLVLCLSIAVKLWLCLFNRRIGRQIESAAILAASSDSLNDVYTSAAILVSTLIGKFTGFQIDGVMGVLVSLFIMYSGYQLIGDTLNPLIGIAPDKELVSAIESKIKGYQGVIGMHDLVIHNYGPGRCFASVHVEVPAKENILVSHDIIDNIERDFAQDMNINLVIHLDPIVTDDEFTDRMKAFVIECVHKIDPSLSIHDFRTVKGTTHTNLIFDITVPPAYKIPDCDLRREIGELVAASDPSYFCVITVDRSYVSTR